MHDRIVTDLARDVTRRITATVVRHLQRMTDDRTSGEDSGLANVWDEICVQVQLERSFLWFAYARTVHTLVEHQIEQLAPFERSALWLQTDAGIGWSCSHEGEDGTPPPNVDDVVQETMNEVWSAAANWSNWTSPDLMDA